MDSRMSLLSLVALFDLANGFIVSKNRLEWAWVGFEHERRVDGLAHR